MTTTKEPALTGRHARWLSRAINLACESTFSRWWLGCYIVKNGRVLSKACNSHRNDPSNLSSKVIRNGGASYHAETSALRNCGDAEGATLYVARVTPTGLVAMARPCSTCMAAAIKAGIERIVYTEAFGKVGVIKL